ncbi:MAG: zinc ribbon domain-containing protein [Anaerolineae bacterium]
MPTYDYQCRDCEHGFEVRATFKQKDAGLRPECPECHSTDTQQAFRSMMFIRSSDGASVVPMLMGCGPNMGPGCC